MPAEAWGQNAWSGYAQHDLQQGQMPGNMWPRPATTGKGPAAEPEPSRAQVPLRLLYEYSAASPGTWRPLVLDEDRRCYAFLWPKAISHEKATDFLKRLVDVTPWVDLKNTKGTSITRSTCWYSCGGCTCDYTYGKDTRVSNAGAESKKGREPDRPSADLAEEDDDGSGSVGEAKPRDDFQAVMDELTAHVFGDLFPGLDKAVHHREEAWPNSANVNLYRDGRQAVGWHADDESLFKGKDSDCPVVSVSFGASREFWMALKRPNGTDPEPHSIVEADLADGDLMTMEGRFQKHCFHFVPKGNPRDPIREGRINITFRWVRDHRYRCPLRKRRCLFGEEKSGTVASRQEGRSVKAPLHFGLPYVRCWSYEVLAGVLLNPACVELRSCDECRHGCYQDGRPCCQGQGEYAESWFCRKCWGKWEPNCVPQLPPPLPAEPSMKVAAVGWPGHGARSWWPFADSSLGPMQVAFLASSMLQQQLAQTQRAGVARERRGKHTEPIASSEACLEGLAPTRSSASGGSKPSSNCRWTLWSSSETGGKWSDLKIASLASSPQELEALLQRTALRALPDGCTYSFFEEGVKPVRDSVRLKDGGRWIVALTSGTQVPKELFPQMLDQAWRAMLQGLLEGRFVGGAGVCGAAVSVRSSSGDKRSGAAGAGSQTAKLAIWLGKADDETSLMAVGHVLLETLKLADQEVSESHQEELLACQLGPEVKKRQAPKDSWRLAFEYFKKGAVTHRM